MHAHRKDTASAFAAPRLQSASAPSRSVGAQSFVLPSQWRRRGRRDASPTSAYGVRPSPHRVRAAKSFRYYGGLPQRRRRVELACQRSLAPIIRRHLLCLVGSPHRRVPAALRVLLDLRKNHRREFAIGYQYDYVGLSVIDPDAGMRMPGKGGSGCSPTTTIGIIRMPHHQPTIATHGWTALIGGISINAYFLRPCHAHPVLRCL
jgi:hypothetical protein